ncbi:MAG: Crp/Fnr family transcriptional regulator [Deltaproteobacteria bacterium]|nr:Crp/Fnr family transcriptional regulator [Deltaproteobacteria bacterium]
MSEALREALVGHLLPRSFAPGTHLWREGSREGMLVLLDQGSVRAYRTVQGEREVPIYQFGPGDLFGFMPLLDGDPYPASAVCVEAVRARTLSREALDGLLTRQPAFARVLLSALSLRLRGAFAQIELLSTRGATCRVAATLVAMVPPSGPQPVLVQLPVSHRELAEALNLTAPTLSRALAELESCGAVHRLGAGRYQVLRRDLLLERARLSEGAALGPVL